MIIYEAKMISNNGNWGGCYDHHICYAISEELATIEAIKYMTEKYPNFDWTKDNNYITDKSNTYYPRTTWYTIRPVEVKEN